MNCNSDSSEEIVVVPTTSSAGSQEVLSGALRGIAKKPARVSAPLARRHAALAGLMLALLAASAWGYLFQSVSVADAIKRADAWVKDHPTRAEGYFFLGGIHGAAWAHGTAGQGAEIPVATFGSGDTAPFFVPWHSILYLRDQRPVTPEDLGHLGDAIAAYRRATVLDGVNARYHLGLAWALEEAAEGQLTPPDAGAALTDAERSACTAAIAQLGDADQAKREQATQALAAMMPRDMEMLRAIHSDDGEVASRINSIVQHYWLSLAIAEYRTAYQQSAEAELKAKSFNAEQDSPISLKAGTRLLALLRGQKEAPADEVAALTKALESLKTKPILSPPY